MLLHHKGLILSINVLCKNSYTRSSVGRTKKWKVSFHFLVLVSIQEMVFKKSLQNRYQSWVILFKTRSYQLNFFKRHIIWHHFIKVTAIVLRVTLNLFYRTTSLACSPFNVTLAFKEQNRKVPTVSDLRRADGRNSEGYFFKSIISGIELVN